MVKRVARTGFAFLTLVVILSGCSGESEGDRNPFTPPAELSLEEIRWQDKACNDEVPFTFEVRNTGSVVAKSIEVTIQGGYQDYSTNIGNLAPGAGPTLNAAIKARDRCGLDDPYTVVIAAKPSNGPRVSENVKITI